MERISIEIHQYQKSLPHRPEPNLFTVGHFLCKPVEKDAEAFAVLNYVDDMLACRPTESKQPCWSGEFIDRFQGILANVNQGCAIPDAQNIPRQITITKPDCRTHQANGDAFAALINMAWFVGRGRAELYPTDNLVLIQSDVAHSNPASYV